MARSTESCIARVAAKGSIGQQEAAQIIEDLAERADRMRATGVDDPLIHAAHEAALGIKEKAKADRLDALKNAAARARLLSRAESVADSFAPKQTVAGKIIPGNKVLGIADGLRSLLHWIPGSSAKDNVESMWQNMHRSVQATMMNKLKKLGLDKAALRMHGTDLENEVAEAMWRNHGGTPLDTVTVSKDAQKIADTFSPPLDYVKDRQNAEGARIGTATDYVSHTNWDARQLRLAAGHGADAEAAFEAWKTKDAPRIAEKTYADIEPNEGESQAEARERFLRSVYFATASGVHMQPSGGGGMGADAGGYVPPVFEGSRNLARSASQPRVVFWNNSQDWLAHMREFGGGDGLLTQVSRTIDQGTRRTALMHYLGTNPAANLNMVIRKIQEKYREDLDGLQRFNNQIKGLQDTLGRLDGSLNIPAHADRQAALDTILSVEATAHLGAVSFIHGFTAPATVGAELAHHGVARLETIANVAKAIVSSKDGVDADALADAGAYAHSYSNAMARATGGLGHGIPGYVTWAASHFMRLTGLPRTLDMVQAKAVKGTLMDRLGRQTESELNNVEIHQQTLLRQYGIGPDEWDLLRNTTQPTMVNGRRWMTPSDALEANDTDVEAVLRSRGMIGKDATPETIATAVQRQKWDIADKLGMYLNDAADHAVVQSGVREQAMVLGSDQPGSLSYLMKRALMQFKMWPLAAANQIVGREVAMSLSRKEMASNFGANIALATLGGAAYMALTDAASGRPQRNYLNPVTLLQALAHGGGLGIYADFLFGEANRLGGGGIVEKLGPIGADIDKIMQMANDIEVELKTRPDHALSHLGPALMRFGIGHIPFANLVYLRGALDYLLFYHMYEAASPGWWERTNRRMQREQGRTMYGYTPGGGIPYTPWGIGATVH